jgi:putative tryptophan/tyrosine transport system substrate-binding protein
MRRRDFITVIVGSVIARPLTLSAQQPDRMRHIAMPFVTAENDPQSRRWVAAFVEGLETMGWKVGRNLQIDYRFGVFDDARAQAAIAELLKLSPDLILAQSVVATRAAQQATHTIPIVFTHISEPMAQGFVSNLAHPGGNTTGFSNLEPSVGAKWLELLKEISPQITRIAVMFSTAGSIYELFYRSIEAAAPTFTVETVATTLHGPEDIEVVMTDLGRNPNGGLILLPDTLTTRYSKLIVDLASRLRLPAMYAFRLFVAEGGLMSYGPDLTDQFRQASIYVDRILRGANPGDLPIQQPTKFELAINLKTSKALGLDVPPSLLATADEVIE